MEMVVRSGMVSFVYMPMV